MRPCMQSDLLSNCVADAEIIVEEISSVRALAGVSNNQAEKEHNENDDSRCSGRF